MNLIIDLDETLICANQNNDQQIFTNLYEQKHMKQIGFTNINLIYCQININIYKIIVL